MAENFEVAKSSSEEELSETARHEVVAAQLRGEAKAAGQGPDAVVAAVADELETIGLEPDPSELHRRYEELDPDLPELSDAEVGDEPPPADAGGETGPDAAAEGPVTAGIDASRERSAVVADDDAAPH